MWPCTPTRSKSGCLVTVALLSLSSCGDTSKLAPICARGRILPIDAHMVTPTGRVLEARADGWAVGQLEVDGTLTPVTTLVTSPLAFVSRGWLEHDPLSGRMWLLEDDYSGETPPALYGFDGDGQLEWMVELVDYERPVIASSFHYHEGSLYVALSMDGVWSDDPAVPSIYDSLVIERRDVEGAVVWARDDYGPPNIFEGFSWAALVGVSDSALAMVATPPYTDYGPSYPLTVDIETGEVLWSGSDGHDPLRMAVGDGQLYLGWATPRVHDQDRLPDRVVLEPTSSSLSVHAPSGAQTELSTVEWSAIDWGYSGGLSGENLAIGWMGAELVSLVVAAGEHGVTVHDADGTLSCQGTLELEFDAIRPGVGLEGRSQLVVGVSVGDERGLLLIEPQTEG